MSCMSAQSSRSRSQAVLAQSYQHRDALQEHMRQQQEDAQYNLLLARRAKEKAWRKRMSGSPYTVNLVGESERVAEEMRVKQVCGPGVGGEGARVEG